MNQALDFMDIDALLTEEERLVRDGIRKWVDDRLLPLIGDAYVDRRFPTELIGEIGELGVLGATLPAEYGCAGMGDIAYGLVMQELERGDSGIRSFASVQGALVMYPIHAFGSKAHRREWLPRLASADAIGCFGLTEPDFGSNPAGMRTTARKTEGGWLLNGAKMWITNGSMAHVALIWAQTRKRGDADGIRGFLVPTDQAGFSAKDQQGKLSLLASDTSELVLRDVEVGADAALPEARGLKSALMCLTQARYGVAWGAVGAAMGCYEEAVRYAKNRMAFGAPIAAKQIQQVRLADMLAAITQAQLLCYRLGQLKEAGRATPQRVSLAKRTAVDMAADAAREARRLLGANGILAEYAAMRHMANLESTYTYEGTHDIHSLILGQAITGVPAF